MRRLTPRDVRWLTLLAASALMAAACAARLRPAAPALTAGGVHFVVEQPQARTVAVAGTFNGWSASAHPLTRVSNRLWTATVPIGTGEHLFMYVVDGTHWVSPPHADDYVDDGFGSRNGVISVRPR